MEDGYIGPVRPMFSLEDEPPKNKKVERLVAGTKSSGMVIDITKKGVELNGYYTSFSGDFKYAVLREPVILPWEELDKVKERINKRRKKSADLDRIDLNTDPKYLESLPIVTINGKRFYIDPEKRERRSIERPNEVWRF